MGKYRSVQPLKQKRSETLKYHKQQMHEDIQIAAVLAQTISGQAATSAVGGHTGSGGSAAPANADLSAPQQGVAGVMVAAVGSLQETGFAARRAVSRLHEMQTPAYLKSARITKLLEHQGMHSDLHTL
jgi:hypothetical protein